MSNWMSWIFPFPPRITEPEEEVPPTLKEGEAKELPCRQCQRTNDDGVKICWWCGTENPTKKSK